MPWFIIQSERKAWTKYLVEAQDEQSAILSSDNWQYIGYLDGDNEDSAILGGPHESKADALTDIVSYTEG